MHVEGLERVFIFICGYQWWPYFIIQICALGNVSLFPAGVNKSKLLMKKEITNDSVQKQKSMRYRKVLKWINWSVLQQFEQSCLQMPKG